MHRLNLIPACLQTTSVHLLNPHSCVLQKQKRDSVAWMLRTKLTLLTNGAISRQEEAKHLGQEHSPRDAKKDEEEGIDGMKGGIGSFPDMSEVHGEERDDGVCSDSCRGVVCRLEWAATCTAAVSCQTCNSRP